MDDVFRDIDFVIIYTGDLLVCSLDIKQHKIHFHKVYEALYKHVISLLKTKIEFVKARIE
jgi:hypothetical protein